MLKKNLLSLLVLSTFCISQFVNAQEAMQEKQEESVADLAKKIANPVASLISLPFQNDTDIGIGPLNGTRNTINVQPVIPIGITDNLNLIARIIFPIISQYNITGLGAIESGLGDVALSAYLSPAQSKGGLTWGAGPVFSIPTATDDYFASKKFGIGPSAVVLYQSNGITLGGLVNQIWSVAGNKERSDVSSLFFQPFISYNWKSGAGIGGNFEISQNWEANTTTVWFNPIISGITSFGSQKTQFGIGPRFNLAAPSESKADIGIRAVVVFLFPK